MKINGVLPEQLLKPVLKQLVKRNLLGDNAYIGCERNNLLFMGQGQTTDSAGGVMALIPQSS